MLKWNTRLTALSLLVISHYGLANPVLTKGQELVAAGDCVACHTAPGGKNFAGGLKMSTPIGAIYSTNITPDKEYGIGNYTYDDFVKAVRGGIAKDGHHLYPAMPYISFSKITDADMKVLYEYFMHSVPAVAQKNRDSDIPWPLSMRWPLAIWNQLFYDRKIYQNDPHQSPQWNRGAYLVQGLAHCGTCHTPRGIGFQEKALDQQNPAYLTGGTLEGWHAPDLTGNVKDGLGRWSTSQLVEFLKTGRTDQSAAFGSMTYVIEHSTQYLSQQDLTAIALYLKSLKPANNKAVAPKEDGSTSIALLKGDLSQRGAREYMDNCSACHRIDGKGYAKTFPSLALNSAVLSDDPSSLISVVLKGSKMAVTQDAITGLTMPDFGWRLTNQQVADVVTFIRQSWGNNASAVTADQVKKLRNKDSTSERKQEDNKLH